MYTYFVTNCVDGAVALEECLDFRNDFEPRAPVPYRIRLATERRSELNKPHLGKSKQPNIKRSAMQRNKRKMQMQLFMRVLENDTDTEFLSLV